MTDYTRDTSSKNIKAIQTEYKGYKFRSRLEARWAIYFDAIGLSWEYEIESFDLGACGWYLPDFYLYDVESFAEVKPLNFELYSHPLKYTEFIRLVEKPILILTGTPDLKFYPQVKPHEVDGFKCFTIDSVFVSMYHNYPKTEHRFYGCPGYDDPLKENIVSDEDVAAVKAARSARFEHGESP